ncbi:SusD-like starch-binding protein associating with outer membrane [Chitinophaga skermanii]|uniref:SusD-like starch-binding protein associating with outer membrane n=1 Tax=Chitinophaga skermanii TaxID=331697 RepID=A0A327R4L9_9BACT|nr:SusD/RagB family nutrient-binding outer membrane lipoprotein [Chitinophaga skermanii]RAJ11008.1 SusD-like starch-binding protein associating with outer membrane [Chitinophaga skermanii]
MKKQILSLLVLGAVAFSSCKKYLDVNKNPNTATTSSPELLLPQALTASAANTVGLSDYGSWQVGYIANAGGYGGWGSTLTYNYTTSDYNGVWTNQYDALMDYQLIINYAKADPKYTYYEAVARIMKAYTFQILVDNYGNVPYSQSLKGLDNIVPAYDNAEAIYKDIYNQLDTAIIKIRNAQEPQISLENSIGKADVMFGATTDLTKWIKFANTLKLKLLVRARKTTALDGVTKDFTGGFIDQDVLVNPNYSKNDGKQNPFWNNYHSNYAGTRAGAGNSRVPTRFIISFYNGTKLTDARGGVSFRNLTTANQLGYTGDDAATAPAGTAWYKGVSTAYTADEPDALGILKNRQQGQPIMFLAEAKFLQSEAALFGVYAAGDPKVLFNEGILASYRYLYSTWDGRFLSNKLPETDYAAYFTNNATGTYARLVNWDLATTNEQKLEAIITQKYIALNFIMGHEAWAEYRRTGYPAITAGSTNATATFVSLNSTMTTPDKLPGRILYPSSEYQVNPNNVPKGIAVTDYIFWDRRKN